MHLLRRLLRDDQAANAVEYGLITAVIAIALIGALFFFSSAIHKMFRDSTNQLNAHP